MSRIGKMPIVLPAGVSLAVAEDNTVSVKGPMGELSTRIHGDMAVEINGAEVQIKRPSDNKMHRSLHGLSRSLVNNMVVGCFSGYTRALDIVGVGYRAQKQGNKLVLNMGFSHPVEFVEPKGIEFEVPSPTKIIVKGIDKQMVGEMAANIRKVRRPEPYKGKGIRYENEVVRRKDGKTGN